MDKNSFCAITDLHFNIVVPGENFHGFTFQTQKCEAVPADGDKSSQMSHLLYVLNE